MALLKPTRYAVVLTKDVRRALTQRQLDVYYPQSPTGPCHKPPIIVFIHGGSFIHGSRSNPPQNLVHNNLGAFFASRGVLAVVADYRLVPGAVYPQGSEDVRDALLWVVEHISEGDSTRVYIIGHSAGGVHVATMLLLPRLFPPSLREAVRGVVLIGVPCEISLGKRVEFREAAEVYYGSAKKIAANQPLGILRRTDPQYIATLPHMRGFIAENEPRRIKSAMRMFSELVRRKGGVLDDVVLGGHDHLSPILAVSTGSGEEWGHEVVNWIFEK